MKHQAIFITGTDTGVGKTVVTALLLAYLRQRGIHAVAMKPISSGDRNDARLLRALAADEISLDAINPIHFRRPLAPMVAARMEKRRLDTRPIRSTLHALRSTFSPVLVEGIGGLLVPLRRGYVVRDLVCELRLPLLIVAKPNLGTLNHTALTVEAARKVGIEVLGVVLNDSAGGRPGLAERTNAKAIEAACETVVLGRIPHLSAREFTAASVRSIARRSSVARELARVADALKWNDHYKEVSPRLPGIG